MQPLDLRLKTPNTIIKTDQNQFNQFVKNTFQAIHIKYTNLNIKSGVCAAILAARTAEGDGLFSSTAPTLYSHRLINHRYTGY